MQRKRTEIDESGRVEREREALLSGEETFALLVEE